MKKFSFTNARNVAVKGEIVIKSTPRFLTDDEESREQPSVLDSVSLLLVWFLGLIINTCFFII